MNGYGIFAFSERAFGDAMVASSHGNDARIRSKSQVAYLASHLARLGAKTMVLEAGYIDRDYLEDFAAYHSRCFVDYARTCVRMHFFDRDLRSDAFGPLRNAPDGRSQVEESYLGFVVAKPLPDTVVGRTCLRPFPGLGAGTTEFPTTRTERVNLFGLDLEVESLPFQEQDRDVAACASSALWTVMSATSRLFGHAAMSPIKVTEAAGKGDERHLPAVGGLSALQMATAIRHVGLEPYAMQAAKPPILKIAVLAYLRMGLPCLLLGRTGRPRTGEQEDWHAVAVTGYRCGGRSVSTLSGGCDFAALSIDSLYCHDDGVGPFAEFVFRDASLVSRDGGSEMEPVSLLIPLYHKVRIPLENVVVMAQELDRIVEALRKHQLFTSPHRLTWDVKLTTVDRIRKEILTSPLGDADRLRLLTRGYPRFVWQLSAAGPDGPLLAAFLDATDLVQGEHLIDVACFNGDACRLLADLAAAWKPTRGKASRLPGLFRWLVDHRASI